MEEYEPSTTTATSSLSATSGRKRQRDLDQHENGEEPPVNFIPSTHKQRRRQAHLSLSKTGDGEHVKEDSALDEDEAGEEEAVVAAGDMDFDDCVALCRGYRRVATRMPERLRRHAQRWPASLSALLPPDEIESRIKQLTEAVEANANFWETVADSVVEGAGADSDDDSGAPPRTTPRDPEENWSSLQAMTYSLVREWSAEGADARGTCFGEILRSINKHVVVTGRQAKVLVPGAGLMRLPLELVAQGYAVEAIELCMGMVLLGTYLTQNCGKSEKHTLHPFLEERGGHFRRSDQFRSVLVPDVAPEALLSKGPAEAYTVTIGEFLETTAERQQEFDAVATSFFLDTASIVLEYVARIRELLRPGGIWVNVGPLHFHWADAEEGEDGKDVRFANSMELSWESLRKAIENAGFCFVETERFGKMSYTSNSLSSVQIRFKCVQFVVRRDEQ